MSLPTTEQGRIDHAKRIRKGTIRAKNIRALAEYLATQYDLAIVSVEADRFTLSYRREEVGSKQAGTIRAPSG